MLIVNFIFPVLIRRSPNSIKIRGVSACARFTRNNAVQFGIILACSKLQKLKVSSMSQGVVITSFERVTPKYFSKSNDHVPSKNTESCFNAIPSREGWSKQQGFKDRLSAELQTFKIAHAQTIDNALGFGELRNLAIMSLTESVAFAEALIKFLDETVEEFRVTKLGNAKSFHIGTSMVLNKGSCKNLTSSSIYSS